MIEGLFVGLLMMCLDADRCGGEHKALLINATAERCDDESCTVCDDFEIALHSPRLYIHMSDVVTTSAPLTRCDAIFCDDNDDNGDSNVFYWDLARREICFNVGPGNPSQEPGRSRGDRDPRARNADKALDWIPSMTRFHTGFVPDVDLSPGARNPVVASVDLGPGSLHASRLSRRGRAFSHWRPQPDTHADREDFPRTMAEAIVWRPVVKGNRLIISDCNEPDTQIVLDRTRQPRFIVANLPEPCQRAHSQKKLLHFGAYYELASSTACVVPELVADEEPPEVKLLDFEKWLARGDFSSVSCDSIGSENLETTLCPPSKFP